MHPWAWGGAALFAFLAVVILLAGFAGAVSSFPVEPLEGEQFDAAPFADADQVHGQSGQPALADEGVLVEEARAAVGTPDTPLLEALNVRLAARFGDRLVVAVRVARSTGGETGPALDPKLEAALDGAIRDTQQRLDRSGWSERYELEQKLAATRAARARVAEVRAFLADLKVETRIPVEGGTALEGFHATAGTFRALARSGGSLYWQLDGARPVLAPALLVAAGATPASVDASLLQRDARRWTERLEAARAAHQRQLAAAREAQQHRIEAARSRYRQAFWERWYPVLVRAASTFLVSWALVRYGRLVRRRDVPRRRTFHAYFATNVTAGVFRWAALLLVGLGIAELWFSLLAHVLLTAGAQLLAGWGGLPGSSGLLAWLGPILGRSYLVAAFALALLGPALSGVLVVLGSWLAVLQAELMCFIGNLYQIAFDRAQQAPGAGEGSAPAGAAVRAQEEAA